MLAVRDEWVIGANLIGNWHLRKWQQEGLKLIEIPDVSFAMLTAINNRLLHTHTHSWWTTAGNFLFFLVLLIPEWISRLFRYRRNGFLLMPCSYSPGAHPRRWMVYIFSHISSVICVYHHLSIFLANTADVCWAKKKHMSRRCVTGEKSMGIVFVCVLCSTPVCARNGCCQKPRRLVFPTSSCKRLLPLSTVPYLFIDSLPNPLQKPPGWRARTIYIRTRYYLRMIIICTVMQPTFFDYYIF
jgi:hypothetical protein